MLKAEDYPPGTPIYSYVDSTSGENFHVDSDKLRIWCAEHRPEVFWTPVNQRTAAEFLMDNIIDMVHVCRVALMPKLDPVIYGKFGSFTHGRPDVMLIDGHHRYFVAASNKAAMLEGYVLEREQWEPFRIMGLPDLTEQQLREAPIRQKGQRT